MFESPVSSLQAPTPEPEAELTEADLPDLQEAVSNLQQEYDDAVVVKHNLKNDVESSSERLKAATGLLQRYYAITCRIHEGLYIESVDVLCFGLLIYTVMSLSGKIQW